MIQVLDANIRNVTYPFSLDEPFSKTSFLFVSFYRLAETTAVSFFLYFFTSSKEMDMHLNKFDA